jgi:hypothetical protein
MSKVVSSLILLTLVIILISGCTGPHAEARPPLNGWLFRVDTDSGSELYFVTSGYMAAYFPADTVLTESQVKEKTGLFNIYPESAPKSTSEQMKLIMQNILSEWPGNIIDYSIMDCLTGDSRVQAGVCMEYCGGRPPILVEGNEPDTELQECWNECELRPANETAHELGYPKEKIDEMVNYCKEEVQKKLQEADCYASLIVGTPVLVYLGANQEVKPFEWWIPVYKDGDPHGLYYISDGKDLLAGGDSDCGAVTSRGITIWNQTANALNKEKSESVLSEYLENLFEPTGESTEREITESFFIRYGM